MRKVYAITTPPSPPPPTYSNLAIENGQAHFSLLWSPSNPSNDGGITLYYTVLSRSYPRSSSQLPDWTVFTRVLANEANVEEIVEVPVLAHAMAYEYSVIAQNAAGNSTSSASLMVNLPGVIQRPTILSADLILAIDFSSVVVNWIGDNAATLYLVEYALVGNNDWESTTALPGVRGSVQLDGLTNGEHYQIRVTGVADNVRGPTSAIYNVAVGTKPQDPITRLIPVAQSIEDGHASLSWTEAQFNGFPTTYTLFVSSLDASYVQSPFTVLQENIDSTTFSAPLEQGVIYYFAIQATNELGSGTRFFFFFLSLLRTFSLYVCPLFSHLIL